MTEWVSVADKLPDDDETVLMCEAGQTGLPLIGWYEIEAVDIPGFYIAHTFQNARVHITHWMDLPSCPQKRRKNDYCEGSAEKPS